MPGKHGRRAALPTPSNVFREACAARDAAAVLVRRAGDACELESPGDLLHLADRLQQESWYLRESAARMARHVDIKLLRSRITPSRAVHRAPDSRRDHIGDLFSIV